MRPTTCADLWWDAHALNERPELAVELTARAEAGEDADIAALGDDRRVPNGLGIRWSLPARSFLEAPPALAQPAAGLIGRPCPRYSHCVAWARSGLYAAAGAAVSSLSVASAPAY